jgi:peptide deformylase
MTKKQITFVEGGGMVEWEILKLVDFYDPILRQPTKQVDFESGEVNVPWLAYSLMKTLDSTEGGLGLSANQVGLPWCACAINHIDDGKVYCLINPMLVEQSSELSSYKEGCLSYPGLYLDVGRPEWVVIEFKALNGETVRHKFEGVWATCVMHELDHLRGILFTDRVSPITVDREKRKVKANLKKIAKATDESLLAEKPKTKTTRKPKANVSP